MLAYPTLLSRSYRNAVVNSMGLLGYWPFEEPAGTVAKDEMGLNVGTYVLAPTLGVLGALSRNPGTAVTFNGTTQYATVGAGFLVGDVFTLATWIKRGNTAAAATFMGSGLGTSASFQFISAADKLQIVKAGVGVICVSTVGIAETTTWHFAVWTRSGGGSSDKLYLDGADVTGSLTSRTALSLTGVRFGSDVGFSPWSGSMQHGAIWSRALAQPEIVNLYRIGRGF